MRPLLLASTAVAALSLAPAAFAQSASQTTQLDEVIVTGEKSSRSLQDTQTSVAVTTAERIEREGIQSLQEIYTRTANVSETFGSFGFTIRGMANQGVSGGGNASLSTVYIDGAPIPETVLAAGITDLWDARQVEIFRGPQSTLQGLNALAGAIVIRTEQPGFEVSGRVRALASDADETVLSAAIGGPILADQLAFRLAVEKRDADGFIYNTTRQEDESPTDSLMVRGRLLWRPVWAPALEVQAGYTRFENDGAYLFSYVRTDTPDFFSDRIATNDARNGQSVRADLFNVEATYDLTDRLTLTGSASLSRVDQPAELDGDGGPQPLDFGTVDRTYEIATQEARLNYEGDRVRGLLGVFHYTRDAARTSSGTTQVATPLATIVGLLRAGGLPPATANQVGALYVQALPFVPVMTNSADGQDIETFAVFGDGEWRLTDRASLIGGFRFDRETNDVRIDQQASFAGTLPNPAAFGAPGSPLFLAVTGINQGVLGLVAQANGAAPPEDRTFDAFLPKLGLRYDWTDDLSTALVIQRGYRSGGASANTARSQTFAYDPEYTWNYEASLRSAWLDGGLTVNANAYYVDWTDQQVSVNFGLNAFDSHAVNAGKSHLYGFEIDAAGRVSEAFSLYGSVGYTRTKFDEFTAGVEGTPADFSGREFTYAPRWTLAVGGDYRWSNGVFANLNVGYRSSVFSDIRAAEVAEVPGRTLVNGRFGYETDRWGAFVYAKNLLDEDYVTLERASTNQAILGDPRVVGVGVEARW